MIRIEVKGTEVSTRNGFRKDGSPWSMRTQEAYAFTFDANGRERPYPERISLQLDDDQAPYNVGLYNLLPMSIYVGEFGRLMCGRPQLSPIAANAAKAA
jgi:hypothetical protein